MEADIVNMDDNAPPLKLINEVQNQVLQIMRNNQDIIIMVMGSMISLSKI